MKCFVCNQDSIKIYSEDDIGTTPTYISCDICGLHIRCGEDSELLCNLFLYNESIENAEKLGREAYIEDKKEEDNPYSIAPNHLILKNKWEEGWNRERDIYEKEALSIYSEKLNSMVEYKTEECKEILGRERDSFNRWNNLLKKIDLLVIKKYFLGRTYRQKIDLLVSEENKSFFFDFPTFSEIPDFPDK